MGVAGYVNCRIWLNIYIYMVMIGVAEFVVVHWGRLWLSMVMDRCCRICELQDTAEYMVMIGLAEFVVVHWGRLWLSMVMDRCCRTRWGVSKGSEMSGSSSQQFSGEWSTQPA